MEKYSSAGADAHQQRLIDALDDHDPDTGETVAQAKRRQDMDNAAAAAEADYRDIFGLI